MTVYSCNQTHTVHNQAHSISPRIIWHLWHLALAFWCCKQSENFLCSLSQHLILRLEIGIVLVGVHGEIQAFLSKVNRNTEKMTFVPLSLVTRTFCWHLARCRNHSFPPQYKPLIFCSALSGDEAVLKSKTQSDTCRCSKRSAREITTEEQRAKCGGVAEIQEVHVASRYNQTWHILAS